MRQATKELKDIIIQKRGVRINMTLYAKVLEAKILMDQPVLVQNVKFNKELFKL